jgi:hypothetical protein
MINFMNMKRIINEYQQIMEHRLKRICGKPSPMKRLVFVIVVCVVLAVANIWFLVSSVYNIGKNDAEKELMKMQHIEGLELPKRKESKENKEFNESKEYDK